MTNNGRIFVLFNSSLTDTITKLFNELFLAQILQAALSFATTAYLLLMVSVFFFEIFCSIFFAI